jgi:hypothetical protein
MPCYLDLLPDDILNIIKRYIAVNPPPSLNLYEILFFQYINKMNSKQLISYCNDNKIKKSSQGVNNQYAKRMNIIERYLGRKPTRDEELVIIFTRGLDMCNWKGYEI